MASIDPVAREMLNKMTPQVMVDNKAQIVEFTEVEGTYFTAKYTTKNADLIFQFFGRNEKLPKNLGGIVAKAFHNILGDIGMERITTEVIKDPAIIGGETIFVRAKNYGNDFAQKIIVPKVFELIEDDLS